MAELDQLHDRGLKATTPRLNILKLFESNPDRHFRAEEVYSELRAQGGEIGLATVYRVLAQFEAASLLYRHNFEGDHAVYELNQGEHHDHLVCSRCGKVAEFVDDEIERRQELIAEQNQFTMTDHRLTIYGICHQCVNK